MRIDGSGSIGAAAPRSLERPAPPPTQPGDLKSVLSEAELGYFAELERLGPLTYGRPGSRVESAGPPPLLGQRIDVRA
ncbi:MAG: hypothetical protein AB7L66_22770 [Gemmatimonadales bacterium]